MTHKKEIFFSTFRYLCLVAVLALGLLTVVGSVGDDSVTITSGGGETATYNAAEAIGDLAEITFNPTTLEYSYTVIEGIHEGQTDSGTLSLMTGYTDYVYETEDGVPVIVFPGNVFLMIPGGGEEGLMVGVPSLATNYTAAEIAGVYNFVAFAGDGGNIAEYEGTMGTFEVSADGNWKAWQEGDLTTLLDLGGYEEIFGTWEDLGNGVIDARSGDPEVKFANIMIHPGYAENPDEKVLIVDINDESTGLRGIMLGVKQKAITPGSADGDYSLLESDEGSIIPMTVTGNNVIYAQGTSPITYNYPWDGFVVGADNTLELVLPGGVFFGGGAEGGDCWIFAGIRTGGGAPSAAINTTGGNGGRDEGTGGEGGEVTIQKFGSTGPVEVLVSGTVDASFTPTAPDPILGEYPVHITADTTIALDPVFPGDDPGTGQPYMVSGDFSIYISDGDGDDGDDVEATGLSVDAGATLTLPLNSDDTGELYFSDDVANNGTITSLDAEDPTQRGGLVLEFNNYYGASGSAIDTSGTLAGQSGGDVSLHSAGLEPNSGFYNQGAINTAGADNPGGDGGYGGSVELGGWEAFENSGPITTAAGSGGAGDGGEGGNVQIRSGVGYVYNSGAINSTGGNGTGSGGQGGAVSMVSAEEGDAAGELRNSGNVSTTGGNGAGGPGGPGGSIELVGLSADLFNNADLNSAGGDTSDAASWGGDGGSITVAAAPGSDIAGPAGNLLLAGNINSSGGNALAMELGDGGYGGPVLVFLDASGSFTFVTGLPAPTTQRLALLGYANINTSGGNGNYGGDGGSVNLTDNGEKYEGEGWVDAPGGDVTNQAAITTCGGSVGVGAIATPAEGGSGGEVHLYGDQDGTLDPGTERVTNSGNIDTSGGDSLALTELFPPFPNAGAIEMVSTNDVTNTGALTANGGSDTVDDDTLGTGFGHGGPFIIALVSISIDGTTTNSGAINANGGYGETQGGDASGTTVYLGDAVQVVNSGNISVRGGDADTGLEDSVGGDGGNIEMEDADTPDNTGTLDVSGGAGDWPGADGTIFP